MQLLIEPYKIKLSIFLLFALHWKVMIKLNYNKIGHLLGKCGGDEGIRTLETIPRLLP